jgi:hypothetical protein
MGIGGNWIMRADLARQIALGVTNLSVEHKITEAARRGKFSVVVPELEPGDWSRLLGLGYVLSLGLEWVTISWYPETVPSEQLSWSEIRELIPQPIEGESYAGEVGVEIAQGV